MSLLERICKELGVKVGERWTGNDGGEYKITSDGVLFYIELNTNPEIEVNYWEKKDNISRLLTGELKPIWKPETGEKYYIPYIHSKEEERQINYFWNNDRTDKFMWNNNLVFKTKEEAIEVTNKILEFLREVN